jgi:cytoskeleton protein RodZ
MGSFGDRLKKEREQKSISLDDISLSTKIGTRLLRALEEEKFDQLPGGIFNKGFVRAYARHVGLDEEQAISDYMAALGDTQPRLAASETAPPKESVRELGHAPVHDAREPQQEIQIPWGLLALVLLLAALAIATWSYYHRSRGPERTNAAPPSSTQATPALAAPSNRGEPLKSAPPDNGKAASTPIPTAEQSGLRSAPVAQAALHDSASPEVAPGSFRVTLKINDDAEECWMSIVTDGQPPVEVTLTAPYEKVLQAKDEIIVKAGNAGALDVFFNGKKLGPLGDYGTVRTLTFHKDGLQPPAPKPATPPAGPQ